MLGIYFKKNEELKRKIHESLIGKDFKYASSEMAIVEDHQNGGFILVIGEPNEHDLALNWMDSNEKKEVSYDPNKFKEGLDGFTLFILLFLLVQNNSSSSFIKNQDIEISDDNLLNLTEIILKELSKKNTEFIKEPVFKDAYYDQYEKYQGIILDFHESMQQMIREHKNLINGGD